MNLIKKLAVVAMILFSFGIQNSYTFGPDWSGDFWEDPDWEGPDIKNLRTFEEQHSRIDYLAEEIAKIVNLAERIGIYDSISDELEAIILEWTNFKHAQVRGYEVDLSLGLVKSTRQVKNLKMKVETIAAKRKAEIQKTLLEIGLIQDLMNITSEYAGIEEEKPVKSCPSPSGEK